MFQKLGLAVLVVTLYLGQASAQDAIGSAMPNELVLALPPEPVLSLPSEIGILTDSTLESIRRGRPADEISIGYDHITLTNLSFALSGEDGVAGASPPTRDELCRFVGEVSGSIVKDRDSLLAALYERYETTTAAEMFQTRPWRSAFAQDAGLLGAIATRLLFQAELVSIYDDTLQSIFCDRRRTPTIRLTGHVVGVGADLALAIVEDMAPRDRPIWANPLWGDLSGESDEVIVLSGEDEDSVVWRSPPSPEANNSEYDRLLRNWQLAFGAERYSDRAEWLDAIVRIIRNIDWDSPPDIYIENIFAPHAYFDLSDMALGEITVRHSAFSLISVYRSTFSEVFVEDSAFARLSLDSSRGGFVRLHNVAFLADPYPSFQKEVDLGFAKVNRLDIDGVKPGRRLTLGKDWQPVGGPSEERLEVNLYETDVETWLNIANAELSRIDALYMSVGGWAGIKTTNIREFAKFASGRFVDLYFTDVTLPSNPDNEDGLLQLGEMIVQAELQLNGVVANDIYIAKTTAKAIRSSDLQVGGLLSLWSANAEYVGLGLRSAARTEFSLIDADRLEVFASGNLWTGQQLNGRNMEVRHLQLNNAQLNEVAIDGLRAEVAVFFCTSVAGQLGVMRSKAHEIYLNRVDATTLDIRRAEIANLQFTRPELEQEQTYEDALAGVGSPNKHDGAEEPTQNTEEKNTQNANNCSRPGAPWGTFTQVWLDSAKLGTLRLNGVIKESLFAPRLNVEKLAFAGDRARLGPKAIVNLTQATVGSLALPRGRLKHSGDNTPLLWIDGAQIGIVRIYNPYRDGGGIFPKDPTRPGYWPVNEESRNIKPYGRVDYDALLYEELLPALSLAVTDRTKENYSGETYLFLRRSMDDAGFPGLARDVAVMQNDHYALTLGSGESMFDDITGALLRQIYRLGKFINSYGYDNGRAVLWLFLLWVAGVAMLSFDAHRNGHPTQMDLFPRRRAPWWPSLFLSADRTIPNLGIDENFSRPAFVDGRLVQRSAAVTVLLYMQRLLAFVVVIFMVGGVLDVFQ